MHRLFANIPAICFLLSWAPIGWADEKPVDFAREILPVLSDKCFVCHGPDTREEGLVRLDSFEGATADLGGYSAINLSDPAESELLVRVHSESDPMPPEDSHKQLNDAEKQLLERWVREGGEYSQHWAFVRPEAEELDVSGSDAIDHFVQSKLQMQGLELAAEAPPEVLARRLSLVLTGFPPTPEEAKRFSEDYAATSGEKAEQTLAEYVDGLLAKPQFGEHQARYWLDAARYGDTHGLHLDSRRGIYPYRDWVVKAFNENLPLNDFVTWQLAGDLLPDPTLEQKVASGFVRLNPSTSEGGAIPEEFQAKYSFDRTETIGTVFLGMSMTCARCHTHKYDPITQREYYELFAFFNSTAEQPMDRNAYVYGDSVKAPSNQQQWSKWSRRQHAITKLLSQADSWAQGALSQDLLDQWRTASKEDQLKQLADPSGAFAQWELRVLADVVHDAAEDALEDFTTTLVARELDKPRETFVLHRGEYDQPTGEPLTPDAIKVMGPMPDDAPRNRLGLAQWLTSPQHPLTSRVMVNQLWQRVFGFGLVRTPEDFGVQGQQPTHPRLLDWLALELQRTGWDQKAMLRKLVLSKTFRQSSARRSDVEDPENLLLARGPSYRLDAEVIRDLGLWASNLLDPTMGGEGVKPYQPPGLWKALAHPASNTKEYVEDTGDKLYRRSLYVYWKRTSPHPMMTLFDAPSRESSCVRRTVSNTSLQSLALLNETQRLEMARKLAERLVREAKNDEQRLTRLFELLVSRPPNEQETDVCMSLLESMLTRYKDDPDAAKQLLAYGEADRNKKLDQVQLAAWTQVSITILASDLAILLY
ncbi:MAG: DUF1553 domain-containing protein [Aureliella sp.]